MKSCNPRRRALLAMAPLALAGCAFNQAGMGAAVRSDTETLLRERSRELPRPEPQLTRYTEALERFGRLLEVYRNSTIAPLYVQSQTIGDATGLSHPLVGAELPTDITEILRTSVNRIGKKVVYVPYNPDYLTTYSRLGATMKLRVPNVLITGAITEFDRAIAAAARGADAGILFGRGKGSTDASAGRKAGYTISRLALDLNLQDVVEGTFFPGIQAANSIQVLNETGEGTFDFAIFGNGFGLNSNTRYLQGRHSAIRLLVDFSVVQLLGRHLAVPYWRCLPQAAADPAVMARVGRSFLACDTTTRVKWLQSTLRDYGFALAESGSFDIPTRSALESTIARLRLNRSANPHDGSLFAAVYSNIPVPSLIA